MTAENKQKLLDAMKTDFVKKNRVLTIILIVVAVVIVLVAVLTKAYFFACISIPFIAVAVFTFNNAKKFSNPDYLDQFTFSEEICTVKTNELSTTGNIRYLMFSNGLRYDISFTEASLYNEAKEGSHFLMVTDPKKNCILKLIPDPESDLAEADKASSAAPVLSKENLPGLSVSLKNMMDQNDRPIIVCNLLHQVAHLNQAATVKFSADQKTIADSTTLFDLIAPENMLMIQKALVWFAETSENHKADGWPDTEGHQINIYALRDNDSHLSGYYLQ